MWPFKQKPVCQHKWEEFGRTNIRDRENRIVEIKIILRCIHCGDLKNHTIDI